MALTSETRHAKNVTNFQDLIEFVTGYGVTCNPTTGLVETAKDVKNYIKAIFGTSISQYGQVKEISFRGKGLKKVTLNCVFKIIGSHLNTKTEQLKDHPTYGTKKKAD